MASELDRRANIGRVMMQRRRPSGGTVNHASNLEDPFKVCLEVLVAVAIANGDRRVLIDLDRRLC